MARKTTISKEVILEAALKMLIRDGYASVNVKTLAAEIGCSTQPIVWHFENMEGLRRALSGYAMAYAAKKAASSYENNLENFEFLGRAYVKMALKEPNLSSSFIWARVPWASHITLRTSAGRRIKR